MPEDISLKSNWKWKVNISFQAAAKVEKLLSAQTFAKCFIKLKYRRATEYLKDFNGELVITFGAACSPCSALHVMRTNAREHVDNHPRAIAVIYWHRYMHEFIKSFGSIENAIEISKQV